MAWLGGGRGYKAELLGGNPGCGSCGNRPDSGAGASSNAPAAPGPGGSGRRAKPAQSGKACAGRERKRDQKKSGTALRPGAGTESRSRENRFEQSLEPEYAEKGRRDRTACPRHQEQIKRLAAQLISLHRTA